MNIDITINAESVREREYLESAIRKDGDTFSASGLIAAGGRLQRAESAIVTARAARAALVEAGAASLGATQAALGLVIDGTWRPIDDSRLFEKACAQAGVTASWQAVLDRLPKPEKTEKAPKTAKTAAITLE